jgi:hypothetical protein
MSHETLTRWRSVGVARARAEHFQCLGEKFSKITEGSPDKVKAVIFDKFLASNLRARGAKSLRNSKQRTQTTKVWQPYRGDWHPRAALGRRPLAKQWS